jgi:hypothetical protein
MTFTQQTTSTQIRQCGFPDMPTGPDNRPTRSTLNFSDTSQLTIKMSKADVVVGAGITVCASVESATVIGLASGKVATVPSSAFFPSLAATL